MERQSKLEEEGRKLTSLTTQLTETEARLTAATEGKQRLEAEREELVAKIEAGEGASEVIGQMKQENVS